MARRRTTELQPRQTGLAVNGNRLDHNRFDRYVPHTTTIASGYFGNFIHYFRSGCHPCKNSITTAILTLIAIQKSIACNVDEELTGGTIGVTCACHGQRVLAVLKSIAGFVSNGSLVLLLLHIGCEATALDHEIVDDAVEDGSIVKALGGIFEEVLGADRSIFFIELDLNVTVIGLDRKQETEPESKYGMKLKALEKIRE